MNILVIADIHGALAPIKRAGTLLSEADAVVIAGDISRRGAISDAESVFAALEEFNKTIIAVHGNWDGRGVISLLETKGYTVHARSRTLKDAVFFGCGGVPKAFLRTRTMYSEEEIARFLHAASEATPPAAAGVLVTHVPPRGLLDRTLFRTHAGSRAVREFVDARKPRLALCGHIHEDPGTMRHGDTLVVNPGSFRRGKYCSVIIDGEIRAEPGVI